MENHKKELKKAQLFNNHFQNFKTLINTKTQETLF